MRNISLWAFYSSYQHLNTSEKSENDMGGKGQSPSVGAFDNKCCGGQNTKESWM